MKTLTKILAVATAGMVLGGTLPAKASVSFTTSDNILYTASQSGLTQVIPDNTPSGVAYSLNFSPSGLNISSISVSFATSGGYNGDIYAYLSHANTLVQLVNQVTGAANSSGFNVTLVEGTGNPIQTATGTAGAVLSGSTFTASQNLATFNSTDPNGAWTLFFADLSPGDTSTLNSFSVAISAVPEPVNVALGLFGGVFAAGLVGRWMCHRRLAVKAAKVG